MTGTAVVQRLLVHMAAAASVRAAGLPEDFAQRLETGR